MTDNNIDWFIVFSQDEHLSEYTHDSDRYIRALSSFTGSAGTLLVSGDEAYLWTDSRYFIQAQQQLKDTGISLMRYGTSGVPPMEEYLSQHVWEGQRVGFDFRNASYDRYEQIRKKLPASVEICDGHDVLKASVNQMPPKIFEDIRCVGEKEAGESVGDKLLRLRKKISREYPAMTSYTYVLSDLTCVMWLFNLRGADIPHVPVAYSYALITGFSQTLYINRKKLCEEAKRSLEDEGVIIKEYSLFYKDLDDIATDNVIADRYSTNACILMPFAKEGMYVECCDPELIPKAVKNSSEISGMKSAHLKDAKTMIGFIRSVKDAAAHGMLSDEYETGLMLDGSRLENGCEDTAFDTICAYGKNSAIVHYVATKDSSQKIDPKGFLLVDSGGQYPLEGTTDITRTVSLGEVSKEEKEVYTTVLKGNLRLMDIVFPEGCEGTLLDAIAEQPLWERGYFCGHGIGHGVGCNLSVHESEARIARRTGSREIPLRAGVIVSDEPGIYMEGKFGVRLENLLLVEKADPIDSHPMCRFTALTLVPFDKESIDTDILDENEIGILKRYYEMIGEKVAPLLDEDTREWLFDQMKLNI